MTDPLALALYDYYGQDEDGDESHLAALAVRAALDAAGYEVRPKGEVAAERARIVAGVEGLTSWPRVVWFAYDAKLRDGTPVNPTEDRVVVDLTAVLRVIEGGSE